MYSYSYDIETGGIILNSTPTIFSKEPRPVYASEMDLMGFGRFYQYEKQDEIPYMWAEANVYWHKGVQIAKTKSGDIYCAPELIVEHDVNGDVKYGKSSGHTLEKINIALMCEKNIELMTVIEDVTVKKIVKAYEKYKKRLDIFHVAYSGGKDSAVLLDLVKKALPKESFVVIFGDTGMEFPDTYDVVNHMKKECEADGIPFYVARSQFEPEESWKLFGPPARVLRWCCSVHKSAPQTMKMREITGKDNYIGLDFVGIRAHESVARSKYDYENFGKKQKGQYSYNPILEWTSAEVWLYIFSKKLMVNKAYKKGNSRAGCLFCPMGGGKGDFVQNASYKEEVRKYIDMINSMNARNAGDTEGLRTYVSNGGWNARKNGRDLTINEQRYKDEIKDKKVIITVKGQRTDWREWIKTLGNIPFEFEHKEAENSYQLICNADVIKKHAAIFKKFRQVFRKAACCVGCKVCETNCRNGCISFNGGKLTITNCIACGQCHEIDDGCLVYHSLRISNGVGTMRKESINSFANHAPKPEWVQEFFDVGEEYWIDNQLNKKNQEPKLKIFFRDGGFTDVKGIPTELFDIVSQYGYAHPTTWGLFMANFAYNKQCHWYIENMDTGVYYSRNEVSEWLVNKENVSQNDATSIINAYKRLCALPLGTAFDFGYVEMNGIQIDSLCRCKCNITDNRVLLYALYVFAEKCNMNKEFHISYLYDEEVDRDGISPVRIYGLYDEEELKSMLLGLASRYPEYINATFTNDLKTITLYEKTSSNVLALFKEEM